MVGKIKANNTKTIVTMLKTTDGAKTFLDELDFTTDSETGEKLVEVITKSKQIAKEKYNVNIYVVVTNNG